MKKQLRHFLATDFPFIGFLLLVTLVYSTAVADAWYTPRIIALAAVLIIGHLILWRREIAFAVKTTLPFVAYVAVVVLAFGSLQWAPNFGGALHAATRWLIGLIVFFTALSFLVTKKSSEYFTDRLSWTAIVVVLLSAALGAVELNPEWGDWVGLSGNRNQYSSYLFLLLPFVLGGWSRSKTVLNVAVVLTALAIVAVIATNNTRAVWFALLVGVVVYFIVYYSWFNILRYGVIAFTLFLTAVLSFSENLLQWLVTQGGVPFARSLAIRLELWSKSLPMIAEHPLLGHGLYGWRFYFPAYWKGGVEQIDLQQHAFQSVHNDWLQLLIELGILGFLAYFLFFAVSWWRALNKAEKSDLKPAFQLRLLLSVVPAYLVIAFFSFPGERIEHVVLINLVLAMLYLYAADLRPVRRFNRATPVVSLALSVGVLGFGWGRFQLEEHMQKVRVYRIKQQVDPAAVVWHSTQAWRSWHTLDEHGVPIKWYTGNALVALNQVEQAQFYFEEALKEQPHHLQSLTDLAAAEVGAGHYTRAKALYQRALAIFPAYGEARKNLAVTYLNTGVVDSALEHMRQVPLPDKINFIQSLLAVNPLPPYSESIKHILREAVLDTVTMNVYRNKLARRYVRQNNYAEAWDWYATSVELNYTDVMEVIKIARHFAEMKDKNDYNKVLAYMRGVSVSEGNAAIMLAQFFMERNERESAVFRLKTADCPLTPSSEQLRSAIWVELALPAAEKPTCE